MVIIAQLIAHCIDNQSYNDNKEYMKKEVQKICKQYPLY